MFHGYQPQQYRPVQGGPLPVISPSPMIRDVWADNLEEEFKVIRELVEEYPYVAMDTEFPGVVLKAVGHFTTAHEHYYQSLKLNVNALKIIQVGITLLNERGEVPDKCCTWQFNFHFCVQEDVYAVDSIEMLKLGGLNFDHFESHGIDMHLFSELLYSSGLVMNPRVKWIVFHGGFDFAYLVKGLRNENMPDSEEAFLQMFHRLFPSIYDVKYLLRLTDVMPNAGLDYLAEYLSVKRLGTAHQAGSDSLMTGHCFFKLIRDKFPKGLPESANGVLFNLIEDPVSTGNTPMTPFANSQGGSQFPSAPASR